MRVQIRFLDEETIIVDTTTAACAVFPSLTATESARSLEEVANLPPEELNGEPTDWHLARIGGEWCRVRKVED